MLYVYIANIFMYSGISLVLGSGSGSFQLFWIEKYKNLLRDLRVWSGSGV